MGGATNSSLSNRPLGAALVVEDDEHMRALLCALLRPLGFSPLIEAAGVEEARSHLETTPLALAVIDLCLGDVDGTDLISAIRSHRRAEVHALPIAAISATSTLPRVERAIAVGADAFIAKPFSLGSVERSVTLACIKRQLAQTPKRDVLATLRLFDQRENVVEID